MPTVSPKQYKFMEAVKHDMKPRASGPSREVAKEFVDKTPAKKRSAFSKSLKKHTMKEK